MKRTQFAIALVAVAALLLLLFATALSPGTAAAAQKTRDEAAVNGVITSAPASEPAAITITRNDTLGVFRDASAVALTRAPDSGALAAAAARDGRPPGSTPPPRDATTDTSTNGHAREPDTGAARHVLRC